MKIQSVDLSFYGQSGELLPPSPLTCKAVGIVDPWFRHTDGMKVLMPAQVYWLGGAGHVTLHTGCYVVITNAASGKTVLEGDQTSSAPRYLNDKDVLFEVLPS